MEHFLSKSDGVNESTYMYVVFVLLLLVLALSRFFEDYSEKNKAILLKYEKETHSESSAESIKKLKKSLRSSFAMSVDGVEENTIQQNEVQQLLQTHISLHMSVLQKIDMGDQKTCCVVKKQVREYLRVATRSPSMLACALFEVTNQKVLQFIHTIRAMVHYSKAFQISLFVLFVLQGWNDDTASSKLVPCAIMEAVILVFLLFHSVSTLIMKRVEDWIKMRIIADPDTSVTSEELTKAIFERKIHNTTEPGVFVGVGVVLAGLVTFVIKLAGYPVAFAYARGFILLLVDRKSRSAAKLMTHTMAKSQAVFFVLFFFVIFCTLEAQIMLRHAWDGDLTKSRIQHINDFQDTSLVLYIYILGGENYANIGDKVMATSRYYFLFFGPVAIIGIIFLLALIAAVFESVYKIENKKNASELYIQRMSAYAASFALW